jgi:hypothetical protein
MSWTVTVNNLDSTSLLPEKALETAGKDNPAYRDDAITAFKAAKRAGLVSATLSGGRTPSPYGGADTVVICITGFDSRAVGHAVSREVAADFNRTMRETILAGPDE